MDPILQRCGLSQNLTPNESTTDDCALYARAGVSAIGIFLHKLERGQIPEFWIPEVRIPSPQVAATRRVIRQSGLSASHVVFSGFYAVGDVEHRIEHTIHAMDVAAALDAAIVMVVPGPTGGRTHAQARDHVAAALSAILERSAPNVKLGLEPLDPSMCDYLNSVEEARELIDLVGHPRLGVFPDLYHLRNRDSVIEEIAAAGEHIIGVHVNDARPNDNTVYLPGEGELPLVEIIAAIEATGYASTYDVEVMIQPSLSASSPDHSPQSVIDRSTAAMAQILTDAGVTAPAVPGPA